MTNEEWAARCGGCHTEITEIAERNLSQIAQITLILCHTGVTEITGKARGAGMKSEE